MINRKQNLEDYIEFLKESDFNKEQIDFIIKQRQIYDEISKEDSFYYDSYERDMWYTMNRSGLFEKDELNKSEIDSWIPTYTRIYITETDYEL
jgi:hypothetical protein